MPLTHVHIHYYEKDVSQQTDERTWHITIMMGFALAGFITSAVTLNVAARYISCFLFASSVYAVNSVILG